MSLQARCALLLKESPKLGLLPTSLRKFVHYTQQCCVVNNPKIAMDYLHLDCLPETVNQKMMQYAINHRLYKCIDYFLTKNLVLPLNTSLMAVQNDDLEMIQYIAANGQLHPATLFDAAMNGSIDIVKFCTRYLPLGIEILEIAAILDDVELLELCYSNGIFSNRLIQDRINYYGSEHRL
jgi:hypothetical protein